MRKKKTFNQKLTKMEKYEIIMLIQRLVKLDNKKDMIKALKAVAETEMAGVIIGSDEEIKSVWQKLIDSTK